MTLSKSDTANPLGTGTNSIIRQLTVAFGLSVIISSCAKMRA